MSALSRNVKWLFIILTALYVFICGVLYFFQEKLIFHPRKLEPHYEFNFKNPFEEITIYAGDGAKLHGLLFRADTSRGLIFYLHGNAGAVDSWGDIADTYLNMGYDIFIFDYRGYGKSEGTISGEVQFFEDAQYAYNHMLRFYDEDSVVVIGYSIGSGAAAYLASVNKPGMLVLQAPFYCLLDEALRHYPFIPQFLIRYPFETNLYVAKTDAPVIIFHGDADEVIPVEASLRLKMHLKPFDELFILPGRNHNGMNDDSQFQKILTSILNNSHRISF